MPDDRELADTRARRGCSANQVPGLAAADELVVSRQSEALDSEDMLVAKPLGILFWVAVGWVGLVVVLAILANRPAPPNPDFQNYSAINASPQPPSPARHRRPRPRPAEPADLRGPGLAGRRLRARWPSACWSVGRSG